jgi:hypothetical protein
VHADREKWNTRYRDADFTASFLPHPLAERALALSLPAGPVLDLASGPSGSVLLAAAAGRPSVAVDISDMALTLLSAQARTRQPGGQLAIVQADLETWRPRPASCALVLCTGFWDIDLFAAATRAVLPGGVLAWEALTAGALGSRRTCRPVARPRGAGCLPVVSQPLNDAHCMTWCCWSGSHTWLRSAITRGKPGRGRAGWS